VAELPIAPVAMTTAAIEVLIQFFMQALLAVPR
jgi:hypothetical protein